VNVSGLLGSSIPRSRISNGRCRYMAGSSWVMLSVGGIVVRKPISGGTDGLDVGYGCLVVSVGEGLT